jgi:hypothetical protein
MPTHYDTLETRPAEQREAALMAEQANRMPRAASRVSTAEKENLP